MRFVILIVFALATWRLASMLVRERGPLDMFVWIRTKAGIGHDENKVPYMIPDSLLAGILSCLWCCSVYVGFFWVTFYYLFPQVALFIGVGFSLSAMAIFFDKYCNEA